MEEHNFVVSQTDPFSFLLIKTNKRFFFVFVVNFFSLKILRSIFLLTFIFSLRTAFLIIEYTHARTHTYTQSPPFKQSYKILLFIHKFIFLNYKWR